MCLGLPMRILETNGLTAVCERRGERRTVNLLLVGEPPVGALVLVHLDNAVRDLDAEEAAQIDDALDALAAALRGDSLDGFFADLVRPGQETG